VGPQLNFETEDEILGSEVKDDVGTRFEGYLSVPRPSIYQFLVDADDNAKVIIDGQSPITTDSSRSRTPTRSLVSLASGLHSVEVRHVDRAGTASLKLQVRSFEAAGPEELGSISNIPFRDLVSTEVSHAP